MADPDPEIRRGPASEKFFSPFELHLGLKIRGEPQAPPDPSPGSVTDSSY